MKVDGMELKSLIQRSARKLGYDAVYFDRMRLLKHFGIDLIFDVGANTGQYGLEMRSLGYQGRIVSFEPLTEAFKTLSENSRHDKLWDAINKALGDHDGLAKIHISQNSVSSSLFDILPRHIRAAPMSNYIGDEEITIATLDCMFGQYYEDGQSVLLKMDTQGYEYKILQGATNSLPSIRGIQVEMSLVPLYDGESQFIQLIQYLISSGFSLMSIEPVFRDKSTGQLLAIDGIFYRDENRA